jgi:hypothetical protein
LDGSHAGYFGLKIASEAVSSGSIGSGQQSGGVGKVSAWLPGRQGRLGRAVADFDGTKPRTWKWLWIVLVADFGGHGPAPLEFLKGGGIGGEGVVGSAGQAEAPFVVDERLDQDAPIGAGGVVVLVVFGHRMNLDLRLAGDFGAEGRGGA